MSKDKEKKDIIWLVDDSELIHKAIKRNLGEYDVRSFYSGEEVLDHVAGGEFVFPDLILLDLLMGLISGFDVLERLMKTLEFRDLPVVILSTSEAIDDKVKGLEMGASDYIVKPFNDKELTARVRVHIKMKKNRDELRRKTILDYLTSIYNKRHLFSQLKNHFNMYVRHQSPLSLIFFDIDHFKEINDTYGHMTGDYILKELCGNIKSIIRAEDEFFRYGGEEFVIIAPFTHKVSAEKIAEKIRKKIMNKIFSHHAGDISITLSVGVASLPDDGLDDIVPLLELADKRMLAAKMNGRNRVVSNG